MSEERSLRSEIALLRAEVAGLQARVAELERARGGGSSPHSFQVVTEAETPVDAETPISSFEVSAADTEARLVLAKEIGKFLRRAIAGQPRGTSGRDRLKLQNRCYLVVADFEGKALGLAPEVSQALLVQESGLSTTHYSVAHLTYVLGEDLHAVNLVPIAIHLEKLLVAFPETVWDRRVAKRMLPERALSRAILVEVLTAYEDQPEDATEEVMKLWIGLLNPSLISAVRPGVGADVVADIYREDAVMGRTLIPFGPSLVEVSEEHFAFHSAEDEVPPEEEADPPPEEEAAPEDPMERRMQEVEEGMKAIRDNLAELVKNTRPAPKQAEPGPRKSALRAAPKPAALPGLDPGVVQSAREAGIPEEQLRRVSVLLAEGSKMKDVPGPRKVVPKTAQPDPLDESEPEEVAEVSAAEEETAAGGAPIEKAVVQLTKIVGSLAKEKEKKARDLEALLDGVELEGESSTSSTGKGKAAVYKRLKACLQNDPAFIYETIESLLERDFNVMRSAPGASAQSTSARAWLEHRSRVGKYAATVRYTWILCGIWDCLRSGAVKEARARAALGVIAADQTSIDAGNWLLSQEILLEEPPPLSSFQQRRPVDHWDQPSSRLLDERWQEVLMWRVKSRDSYLESRKRLTGSSARPVKEAVGKGEGSKDTRDKGKGKKGKDKEKKPPVEVEQAAN
eukprot:s216_g26.t1